MIITSQGLVGGLYESLCNCKVSFKYYYCFYSVLSTSTAKKICSAAEESGL